MLSHRQKVHVLGKPNTAASVIAKHSFGGHTSLVKSNNHEMYWASVGCELTNNQSISNFVWDMYHHHYHTHQIIVYRLGFF